MAITSSAKKAIRSSARKSVFNARRKSAVRSVTREIKKLVTDKRVKEAEALISKAYKAIDKAAKAKYFKKGKAARYKSRIVAFIKRAAK